MCPRLEIGGGTARFHLYTVDDTACWGERRAGHAGRSPIDSSSVLQRSSRTEAIDQVAGSQPPPQ